MNTARVRVRVQLRIRRKVRVKVSVMVRVSFTVTWVGGCLEHVVYAPLHDPVTAPCALEGLGGMRLCACVPSH